LSGMYGAEVTLVHIIDFFPPSYLAEECPTEFMSEAVFLDVVKKRLDQLMVQFPNFNFHSKVVIGKTKKSIKRIVDDIGADLAIIGKQDPTEPEHFLGSTTHAVITRTDLDVLVVQG